MAETPKVLGQAAPAANTDTDLYTVPASTNTTVSTITVANRGASTAQIRIAVRPGGAAIANQHYLYFDLDVSANDTFATTIGITMEATDVITVRATTADTSFSAFGIEST